MIKKKVFKTVLMWPAKVNTQYVSFNRNLGHRSAEIEQTPVKIFYEIFGLLFSWV